MDAKKIISIRFELFKMFNNGYSQEQMQDFVKQALENESLTLDDIIEALVTSRFEELVLNGKINDIVNVLKC